MMYGLIAVAAVPVLWLAFLVYIVFTTPAARIIEHVNCNNS